MRGSPAETITVRAAYPDDAAEIAHVHVESWRTAYRGQLPERYLARLDADERERMWRRRIEAVGPDEVILVAERGDAVVGFASAGPTRDRDADPRSVGEVYAVYLLPVEWGLGGGRLLVDRAVAALVHAGFSHAGLWVLEANEPARGFYEHLGWRADGSTKEERFGERVTEVRYLRALGSRP